MFKSENDGIDHINVYSKGKTELGRLMSNFANTPFSLPEDGIFQSIEGYWYWLLTDSDDKDELRYLHGFAAKSKGQKLINSAIKKDEIFQDKIHKAILAKIEQNEKIKNLLESSMLPFDHYYVYGDKIVRKNNDFFLKVLEKARLEIKHFTKLEETNLF